MQKRVFVSLLLVAGCLTGGPLVSSPVAATGRPDLRVSSIGEPPAELHSGQAFSIAVKTTSGGARRAPASVTGFHLATDASKGAPRIPFDATVAVRRLRPGRSATKTVSLTIPPSTAGGTYLLFACADADKSIRERDERNCMSSGPIAVTGPSSDALIDQALASNAITEDQALTYKVLAAFEDPRLPEAYRGESELAPDSAILSDLAMRIEGLDPETQAMLEPFLIPPQYENSWFNRPETAPEPQPVAPRQTLPTASYETRCGVGNFDTWGYLDAVGGKVRVWWLKSNDATDHARAAKMVDAIDKLIWPQFTALMGREPFGDGGGSSTVTCRGGTDALDISLVDGIATSMTGSGIGECSGTWARMLFDRSIWTKGDKWALGQLAHEMFHAVQWSYKVKNGCLGPGGEYEWLMEATAEWAEDYIYPDAQTEFPFAKYYLDEPWLSLDSQAGYAGRNRAYGAYLLPFMAAGEGRRAPQIVREMWDATPAVGSLEAAKAPFAANFDQLWKDFALYNWNQGSLAYYKSWDSMPHTAWISKQETIAGTVTPSVSLPYVSSMYEQYSFDADITRVEITNPQAGVADAGLLGIITYSDGTDKFIDWSKRSSIVLCLDDPEVETLTLVYTNSSIDRSSKITFTPNLVGIAICGCSGDTSSFAGPPPRQTESCTAVNTIVYKIVNNKIETGEGFRSEFDYKDTITITVKMKWVPDKDMLAGGVWKDDGSTWTASGHVIDTTDWSDGFCSGHEVDERTWTVGGEFGGSISPRPDSPDYTKPGGRIDLAQLVLGWEPSNIWTLSMSFGYPTIRNQTGTYTGDPEHCRDNYSDSHPDRLSTGPTCTTNDLQNGSGILEGKATKRKPNVVDFACAKTFDSTNDKVEVSGKLLIKR